LATVLQLDLAMAVGEQSEVAYPLEAWRQHIVQRVFSLADAAPGSALTARRDRRGR
jgi:hypothetical protein